jgi:hypothetical protein
MTVRASSNRTILAGDLLLVTGCWLLRSCMETLHRLSNQQLATS